MYSEPATEAMIKNPHDIWLDSAGNIYIADTDTDISVESLTIDAGASSLLKGDVLTLTATAALSDGSSLDISADASWSSSDEGVATVDGDGVVDSADVILALQIAARSLEPAGCQFRFHRVPDPAAALEHICDVVGRRLAIDGGIEGKDDFFDSLGRHAINQLGNCHNPKNR